MIKVTTNFLLYEKVADTLRKRIVSGVYPVGSRIPSEETLSRELDVSRPTIKKAVCAIENEKLLQCRSAVGSFVVRKPSVVKLVGYIAPYLNDPFHGEVIREMERILRKANGNLLVAEGGLSTDSFQAALESLVRGHAQGLIVSIMPGVELPRPNDVPLVFCGGTPRDDKANNKITIDSVAGIHALMDHLTNLGVKRVGFASAEKVPIQSNTRYQAFLEHVRIKGLESPVEWHKSTLTPGEEGGRLLFREFQLNGPLPEAVVCYNDWIAFGFIRAALESNIRIPQDLKITGFDNLSLNRVFQIPVTTIDYKIPELVKGAIGLLEKCMSDSGRVPESVRIQGQLVIGKSTVQ
ncbi:MAG: substrate-binding domain-containing protein [Fibrobacterota bacterium]